MLLKRVRESTLERGEIKVCVLLSGVYHPVKVKHSGDELQLNEVCFG